MPGKYETIRKAISDDLVAALSAGGYPALTDGSILFGPQHINEASAPPRVVFVPADIKMGPANVVNPTKSSTTNKVIRDARSLASNWLAFEVHVWGAASPPDPEAGDYDATLLLVEQTQRFIEHNLGPLTGGQPRGGVQMSTIAWNDDDALNTRLGREAVFTFAVSTPVVDALLANAPSDVTGSAGVYLDIGDGTPELGATLDPL